MGGFQQAAAAAAAEEFWDPRAWMAGALRSPQLIALGWRRMECWSQGGFPWEKSDGLVVCWDLPCDFQTSSVLKGVLGATRRH